MDSNKIFAVIFGIFVVYTARDLLLARWSPSSNGQNANDHNHLHNHHHHVNNIKKEIPSTSFKQAQEGPTIKILYCYSCGYQKAFEEYRRMILEQFPDLNVIGANYNPSFIKNKIAQLISIVKMIAISFLIANIDPFNYFGRPTPHFWQWMRDHKLYACLMTFFLSNTLESQLMSSGAFEIFYNDVPVWSKLETGRIPSPNELFGMIESQHKFGLDSETLHTMTGKSL